MQPETERGVYLAGKMWSFLSAANDDLNIIYDIISDIPRCDTIKEINRQIDMSIFKLKLMKENIKALGPDYLLEANE